jgi:N-acetylmuramoyl-L-alanine amidase CwlA
MAIRIDESIPARWHGGKRPIGSVIAIVFHYTANTGSSATAEGNARYFAATDRKASAHIVVDTGDAAYLCVPLDTTAWAVGDGHGGKYGALVNNFNSVSIEMVSRTDEAGRYYIPDETVRHAREVYQWLLERLPNVKYTIRHYDVSCKRCPEPYLGEDKWAEFRDWMVNGLEMVEQSYIVVNGKEKPVARILKNGTNYIKLRDLVKAMAGTADFEVSSKGGTPILTLK